MPPPLLQLQDISLSFGVMPLLSGATLAVAAGDRICLVGRNGSGKSTLLRIAAGLVQADTGERFAQPGATIQYLPQEPDLAGFGTTLAYVEAGFRLERGRPRLSSQWTRRWRRQSRANPSLEPKFPASRENTGNFIHFGLGAHQRQAKRGAEPGTYRPIPYASEQGIFCALAGN